MFLDRLLKTNRPLAELALAWERTGVVLPDTYLIDLDALCENARAIKDEADRCGIKWGKMVREVWPATVRGHVVAGPKKPGGAQLTTQMLDEVKKHKNITFLTNTKVIELTKTPLLACTGVKAISKTDGLLELKARAGVVIATGGFHANREMICKYMGGGVAWMPLRGSAYMMGENIELTRPFMPYYTNLDQFHGGPIHGPTQANPSTMVNYGIIVNKEGARILDEVMTYVAVAKKLPSITPDNWAFIVIDQQVVDIPTVKTRIDRYKKAKAPIHSGNTIAELAGEDESFLADLERGNVYLDRVGQIGRKSAHLKFAGIDRQDATGANAFGVSGDLYRNYHRDGLVVEELHEIHVEDVLRDGVELQVLQSRFERLARGEFQIYDECIRRVNQRIQILGIHRKVNRIFTAVDYTRHTTSIT